MMNITRINAYSYDWNDAILKIYDKYKMHITLADQDILSVYFHEVLNTLSTQMCIA